MTIHARLIGALGCAVLLFNSLLHAAAPASTDPAVAGICDDLHKKGLLNGVVLVANGDQVLHHQAYGLASVEHGLAHTLDSRFMVASVTKSITATAVLQSVEQGKLELKKPIASYLTELQGTAVGELTAHELLSHSGGVTAFVKDQIESYPQAAFITAAKTARIVPEGKGKFAYQNENFMLLALLLEKVHGTDFATVLEKQIFTPLGMTNSGVNLGAKVVPNLAAGYVNRDGAWLSPPLNNLGQTFGAGCVYTTSTDLFKFLRALAQRQLLKAETFEGMREPQAGPYSYGWFTRQVGGKRLLAAFGKMPGYSSLAAINDDGLSFIVLNNLYDCPVMPLLQRLVATQTPAGSGATKP